MAQVDEAPQAPEGPDDAQAQVAAPSAVGFPPMGNLSEIMAGYEQLQQAESKLSVVREGLESLMAKGDMVSQEDVVDVAGRIVAEGISPGAMAALLADMPQKPEEIAQWIAGHEAQLQQREAALLQVQGAVRHHMGVTALTDLKMNSPSVAEAEAGEAPQGPSAPMPGANPLAVGGSNG